MTMKNKLGILRFLGTNCDRDIWQAAEVAGLQPEWLWYQNSFNPTDYCGFVLPGGFSYGDYLRSGALAAKAPAMNSLREADKKGLPILGICNGFQILCEAHLLPGTLIRNQSLRFIDRWVDLKFYASSKSWSPKSLEQVELPIAHGDGRYYVEEDELKELTDHNQIWLRYLGNPNGSVDDIAGVLNRQGNVAGLMPHPERAIFSWMGNDQGLGFFTNFS